MFGVGGLGHLAIQYAAIAGGRVVAVDLVDEKLELARNLGAEFTVNASRENPVEAIQRLGGADQAIALLPPSDAPAIVQARQLLDESLRRSILSSADPGLLCRWLAHPSGADDLAAARTLVAVLPGGDPRRAAATATAAAIAQRLSS